MKLKPENDDKKISADSKPVYEKEYEGLSSAVGHKSLDTKDALKEFKIKKVPQTWKELLDLKEVFTNNRIILMKTNKIEIVPYGSEYIMKYEYKYDSPEIKEIRDSLSNKKPKKDTSCIDTEIDLGASIKEILKQVNSGSRIITGKTLYTRGGGGSSANYNYKEACEGDDKKDKLELVFQVGNLKVIAPEKVGNLKIGKDHQELIPILNDIDLMKVTLKYNGFSEELSELLKSILVNTNAQSGDSKLNKFIKETVQSLGKDVKELLQDYFDARDNFLNKQTIALNKYNVKNQETIKLALNALLVDRNGENTDEYLNLEWFDAAHILLMKVINWQHKLPSLEKLCNTIGPSEDAIKKYATYKLAESYLTLDEAGVEGFITKAEDSKFTGGNIRQFQEEWKNFEIQCAEMKQKLSVTSDDLVESKITSDIKFLNQEKEYPEGDKLPLSISLQDDNNLLPGSSLENQQNSIKLSNSGSMELKLEDFDREQSESSIVKSEFQGSAKLSNTLHTEAKIQEGTNLLEASPSDDRQSSMKLENWEYAVLGNLFGNQVVAPGIECFFSADKKQTYVDCFKNQFYTTNMILPNIVSFAVGYLGQPIGWKIITTNFVLEAISSNQNNVGFSVLNPLVNSAISIGAKAAVLMHKGLKEFSQDHPFQYGLASAIVTKGAMTAAKAGVSYVHSAHIPSAYDVLSEYISQKDMSECVGECKEYAPQTEL